MRVSSTLVAVVVVVVSACHVSVAPGAPAEQTVRDVRGATRQLFLDDWIVAEAINIEKVQGTVVKHPANPIIRRDKPWDKSRADLYGSAVYDPQHQRIQLFYAANNVSNGHEDRLAYAQSYDRGKTWTKPEFDLIPFGRHKRTNLIMLPPSQVIHGPCVFRDDHETNPARRYKLLMASYPDTAYLGLPRIYEHRGAFLYSIDDPKLPPGCRPPGMYVAYSPDGIHWETPPVRVSNMLSDTTQSVFWDARIGKYVAYVRARTSNDRSVARMESGDFETWTEPEIVLEGTPSRSIYSMGVTPYEGIYLGTPWIFDRISEARGGPVIWPELAVSRDGKQWLRPFPHRPLVPLGPRGAADSRQIRMSASLVVLDDKILLLYGQTDRPHQVDMRVEIGMATLRRDGFAAMQAGEVEASILTKPLRFDPGRLYVNAHVDPGGYVQAEILTAAGGALPGCELPACVAVAGDSIRAPLAWKHKSTIAPANAGHCRIRFVLKKARLYSFWIEPRVVEKPA